MKKLVTAISVISSLSLTAVPVFAQGNIHVKTNGYAHHVNQKNINVKANKIAHQSIKVNNSVHTTNNYIFNDIKGNWAEQDILDLVQKGILTGMGNNKFEPNGQVTREQFATMVSKFFSLKNASSTQDFNDVSSDRWSYTSIEAAKNYMDAFKSLNGGLDFRPTSGMLREDVAVTLVKILTKTDAGITLVDGQAADQILQSNFKDAAQIVPVLRPYVATAVQYGLIHGADGSFAPTRTLTRAEVAKLLHTIEGMGSQIVVPGDTNANTATADSIGIADPTSANSTSTDPTSTDTSIITDTTNGNSTSTDSSLNADSSTLDNTNTDSSLNTDTSNADNTNTNSPVNADPTYGDSTGADTTITDTTTTDSSTGSLGSTGTTNVDSTSTDSSVNTDTSNTNSTTSDTLTIDGTTNPAVTTF